MDKHIIFLENEERRSRRLQGLISDRKGDLRKGTLGPKQPRQESVRNEGSKEEVHCREASVEEHNDLEGHSL